MKAVKEALENDTYESKVYMGLCAYIREISCSGNSSSMHSILSVGLFPLIMKMSTVDHFEEMLIEITWILTNLTSMEENQVIEYILNPEYHL